jgi:hypothetical protein
VKQIIISAVFVTALVAGVVVARWDFAIAQPATEPMPTYVLLDATRIDSDVLYTDSPRLVSRSLDASRTAGWAGADVFVSVDISGTGTVTVTPQFAVNGSHWSNAKITYASWSLTSAPPATVSTSAAVTTTSSITSTGYTTTTNVITITNTVTQTAEFDVSGASAIASVTQQIVLSADGADYARVPVAGNQMRVKVEWSGVVTPTIDLLLRNN